MNSIDALSQHLVPAAMVVARVSGLAVQGPVLSSPAIPMRIKALLVLSLGLAVYPSAAAASALPSQASIAMLAPLVALEFGIGVFIGFMASMPLLAAQFGGLAMGQQIGLGFARFLRCDQTAYADHDHPDDAGDSHLHERATQPVEPARRRLSGHRRIHEPTMNEVKGTSA